MSQTISRLSNTLDLFTDTYNYNHWIYAFIRPHLGDYVLEAGCGIGNITQFLLNCKQVVCIDTDEKYLDTLAEKAKTHRNLTLSHTNIMDIPSKKAPAEYFDTVICINMLEHIEDDFGAIQRMVSVLKPGGKVLVYVPACNWAYGRLDKALGHFRRYSRYRLKKLAICNKLIIQRCHFVNFIGIFGWFWSARIKKDTFIGRKKAQFVDRIVPFLSAMERLVKPPIGQSLFAVMVKIEKN